MFKLQTKQEKEQRIIQEIHDSFDSAQDRLLSQAKEVLASIHIDEITKQENVADRLIKIGFENVPIVKQVSSLKKQREEKQTQIVKTKAEAELIEYYKMNYPFLKFLTESELDKICNKYNLVYAPVKNYKESVPEKNLIEIERAQVLGCNDFAEDVLWCELVKDGSFMFTSSDGGGWCGIWGNEWYKIPSRIDGRNFRSQHEVDRHLQKVHGFKTSYLVSKVINFKQDKSGLFICAPQSHFNTEGLKKKGLGFFEFTRTEIKDPIVFRYVRGGVQVLSKWGLEASDPMLLNPINN